MSREKHLKRLKSSLNETQSILGDLIAGTSKDASKRASRANRKLQSTYEDARVEMEALLEETSRDVQKQYKSTSKDVKQQYASTKKDFDKQTTKAKDQLQDRYADASAAVRAAARKAGMGASAVALAAKADLPSRAANAAAFLAKAGLAAKSAKFLAKTGLTAKAVELATKADLKNRTASLLENAAGGIVSARNRLSSDDKLVLNHESDRRSISKAGYFVRFSALAIIIISKRHKLMELGTQLYNRLKDSEGRAQLTQEAKDQFDTMRRLINAYASGQYREFPYRSLVKIVAAVVYFVSVADLIPDFIPVLGLTDDLAILAWVFSSVKDDLQQFVDWEAAEEKRRNRLANKAETDNTTSGITSESSMTGSVANVGTTTAAPDRKASPNVTTNTGSETGSKATVTTGTGNTASTGGTIGGTTGAGLSGDTGSTTTNTGNRSGGSTGLGSQS